MPVYLWLVGVIDGAMYAYYESYDPIKSSQHEKPDQMLLCMVLEIFNDLSGMAGVFVAASFSAILKLVYTLLRSCRYVTVVQSPIKKSTRCGDRSLLSSQR